MTLEGALIGYGAVVHLFAWIGVRTVADWADVKLDLLCRRQTPGARRKKKAPARASRLTPRG